MVALCSAPACLGPIDHEGGSQPPTVGTAGRFGPICNDGRLSLVDGLSLPRPVHYLAYEGGVVEEAGWACAAASAFR